MSHKTNEIEDWGQESGVDAAAQMLRNYNPKTNSWNFSKKGDFWEAVKAAHRLGRFGEGQTIAVVDDGFDVTIPVLAKQTLVDGTNKNIPSAHGTVVALLILAVAPKAHLLLYPTTWNEADIENALYDINKTKATIVNLSFGRQFSADKIFRSKEFLRDLTPWSEMAESDIPFWVYQNFSELDDWRELINIPLTFFEKTIESFVQSERTVFAAAGNKKDFVFDPALRPSVISVSFKRIKRYLDSKSEEAVAVGPSFSQSEFTDIAISQPRELMGTSVATPQMSGFAALMTSRQDISAYVKARRLVAMAESLMIQRNKVDNWSNKHEGVIDNLFVKALRSLPHLHIDQDNRSICPDCMFLAANIYINFGLFKFEWGDLDGAEKLLVPAVEFAPTNPHAAANLGMVYALKAQQAQKKENFEEVSRLLTLAAQLQGKASSLRPTFEDYQRREKEFTLGAQDPYKWKLAP